MAGDQGRPRGTRGRGGSRAGPGATPKARERVPAVRRADNIADNIKACGVFGESYLPQGLFSVDREAASARSARQS